VYWNKGLNYIRKGEHSDNGIDAGDITESELIGGHTGETLYKFLGSPSIIASIVCFFASCAYLAMATNHGFYVRCEDGRSFYYARYIDWIITTPLMLHALALFGNADDDIWHFMFFNDVLMIASGLIGSTVSGGEKWIFFGFSMLVFIPILIELCKLDAKTLDARIFNTGGTLEGLLLNGSTGAAILKGNNGDANGVLPPYLYFFNNYRKIMQITVFTWSFYPIVWILAEGTGTISVTGETIFYTILDVLAKAFFGYKIAFAQHNSPAQLIKDGKKRLSENYTGGVGSGSTYNGGAWDAAISAHRYNSEPLGGSRNNTKSGSSNF